VYTNLNKLQTWSRTLTRNSWIHYTDYWIVK